MIRREHEDRSRNAVARVHRRTGSIPPIRRRYDSDSFRSSFHACTPRTRIQEESSGESESERTQAKGQAFGLGPRFPRHGLVDRFRPQLLASEFRIGQPLAADFTDDRFKSPRVVQLPIIEPARLFVDIAKQVERFNTDIGSVQTPPCQYR